MAVLALCVLCGLNFFVSCGRKGPPLPPLLRLPAAVTAVTARRVGQDVVFQFTIPTANTDGRGAVDLDHVEVYAHTGPLPAPLDFLKFGTLIGKVAVKAPAAPGDTNRDQLPGFDPGAVAAVSETITPAQLEIGKMPIVRATSTPAPAVLATDLETPGTVNAPRPLMRYYVAVATNRRNRRGAFSPPLGVPLVDPFAAPAELRADYSESAVTLTWGPAAGVDDVFAPSPAYNVYEVQDQPAPAPEGPPVAGAPALNSSPLRAAVNPKPVALAPFNDTRMEFGARRCYQVRTVRVAGGVAVESTASAPACVTLTDTFPPAAPKDLQVVSGEGRIDLIWESNNEKDVAGYVVLRGTTPTGKLEPITPAPIPQSTFTDTVAAGVQYWYAVQAIDKAGNASPLSDRRNEAAR